MWYRNIVIFYQKNYDLISHWFDIVILNQNGSNIDLKLVEQLRKFLCDIVIFYQYDYEPITQYHDTGCNIKLKWF